MRNDYLKNKFKWLIITLLIIFILLATGVIIKYYPKKTSSLNYSALSNYVSQVVGNQPVANLNVSPDLSASMIPKDEAVQFEFYQTLPNMEFKKIEPAVVVQNKINLPPHSTASELEQQLAAKIKRQFYIIQLAMFDNLTAAKHYHQTLSKKNIAITLVPLNKNGKKIYRAQLGPFISLHEARITQNKLRRLGIASLLRNVNFSK